MKKVFLTAMIAAAFAFGMTSCNNNAAETETDTTAQTECCEHECENHVEGCAEGDCDNCQYQGTDKCCKANGGEGCENAGECEHAGECENATAEAK